MCECNKLNQNARRIYVHYGHNYGTDPVCNWKGVADRVLPHGAGFTGHMEWCKECQRILQKIHGPHTFQNIQLELPGFER